MPEKSLKKNAFYSVLKVFLSLIFPLITFPYASRILLPEGIGKVNFANNIISYFIIIACLGIGGYSTREASKVKNDKNALTKLFLEIITINFVCCVVAYILFFISLNVIPKFSAYRDLLLVCSIKIFFSVLGIEWIYTANEDFKYLTIRSFIIQLLSVIYLYVFVKTKDDLIHYAVFGLITSVGCDFYNFLRVGKYINFTYKGKLEFKRHFKPIILFFGITLVTSIYTILDTTMLGFLSNDSEVGYYTASTKVGHMILNLLTALTSVLLPRLTTLLKQDDTDQFTDLVHKCSNILTLLSIPMTLGIIILCKPIIILLCGEQYLPSISSMIVISPIIIFISFGSLTGVQILPSLGKEKISFFSYLCGATTNCILNFILIPKLGALGAAIGTVCAEFVVTSFQVIYLRKLIFTKAFLVNFLQCILSSSIMVFVVWIVKCSLHNLILQLCISTFTGIIIYSLLLFLLGNKCFIFYTKKLLSFIRKKND